MYIYIYTHGSIHIYIYIYIHTYTYIHTDILRIPGREIQRTPLGPTKIRAGSVSGT